jgi:carbamoyltransferase
LRILGISCYFHDAAAALFDSGRLIAAAEEERFTRVKHDYEFPENAIEFCLEQGGITGADLDYVVFFEKPFVKFDRIMRSSLKGFPNTYQLFTQSMRTWLFDKLWIKSLVRRTLKIDPKRILFSEHHVSHAASAYFCSPFDEAAVLTFDGVGEWATTTMGVGRGGNLEIFQELYFPHSLGLLYSVFTAFLGFEINEGEYKVMGMAPYGTPRYVDKVWQVVNQDDNGAFRLDFRYFEFHRTTKRPYTQKFLDLFGEPRAPESAFFTEKSGYPSYYGERPANFDQQSRYNEYYADIAASIQLVTEEMVLTMLRELHRRTGMTNLCLAGGVALNSVANGRILRETPFTELYVQPSAGDGGGSLGGALMGWHGAAGGAERFVMDHAYWGKSYGPDAIAQAIAASGAHATRFENPDSLRDQTVERMLQGKVIGWFNGRFEWGPRALGNRSIIADPRSNAMKDIVNTKIKFREPFRPFAPSVLAEKAAEYFDMPDVERSFPARFMLLVVPVREERQDLVPAVNHLGTARLQTVSAEFNPSYHGLISRFEEATGVPMILNTSFNVRGEPIVNTPENALNTFHNSGIDTLVMEQFLIDKA